jgi:hypothetical protein
MYELPDSVWLQLQANPAAFRWDDWRFRKIVRYQAVGQRCLWRVLGCPRSSLRCNGVTPLGIAGAATERGFPVGFMCVPMRGSSTARFARRIRALAGDQ